MNPRALRRVQVPGLVLLVALTAACAPSSLLPGGRQGGLEGKEWALTSMDGEAPLDGTQITLAFTGGQAGGSSGCNSYGGRYTATARGRLRITETAMTMMACLDPDGVMEQEQQYLGLLAAVTNYRVEGDQLWLETADGGTLVFALQK